MLSTNQPKYSSYKPLAITNIRTSSHFIRAYFHHGICLIGATSFAKPKNLPQQVEKPE